MKLQIIDDIPRMIQALEDEIAAIAKFRKIRYIPIANGKLVDQDEDVFTYVFERPDDASILEEAFVRARVKDTEAEGHLLSVDNQYVTMVLNQDCGLTIPEAQLVIDPTELYQMYIGKLKEITEKPEHYNLALAQELFLPHRETGGAG